MSSSAIIPAFPFTGSMAMFENQTGCTVFSELSDLRSLPSNDDSASITSRANYGSGGGEQQEYEQAAASALTRRLEAELRAVKHTHLSCGEVLLPTTLLPSIAADVLTLADSEPCGLRACTIHITFESAGGQTRKLATLNCDPTTVSTCELHLTLRQDPATSWRSILPHFLKNLARGGTVMISPNYTLEKKKLYRSQWE